MKCEKVNNLLSPFLDDVLRGDEAAQVSSHLDECVDCRNELNGLARLRGLLGSLPRIEAPEYLRHMIQRRLVAAQHDTWRTRLRDSLELHWSKMKTTDWIWLTTRVLGSAVTCVLFLFISAAMQPIYVDLPHQVSDRSAPYWEFRQQLLKNLGLVPIEAQRRPIHSSEPMINDLYLLNFSQNASRTSGNDSFSVVTVVDRTGVAKIEGVLEYPADETLLSDFSSMIQAARCRPASQNGRAIDSRMVLSYSMISVYD